MKSLIRIASAALLALGVAGPAEAAPLYWNFEFSGSGITASGTLTTSDLPDPNAPLAGAYDILSISGDVNGEDITGLLGTVGPVEYSPDGFFIYDNDFYVAGSASAAGAFFDDDGLLFTTATSNFNLFFDGNSYWDWADQGGGVVVTFAAVDPPAPGPVPEPSSGLVLVTGLAGLLLLVSRRGARVSRRGA